MPRPPADKSSDSRPAARAIRIIGGRLRGSTLPYSGEIVTRPMKERVREAIFNLVGPGVKGTLAIDLFAGTGALGIEAVSRGAVQAILVERHFPTAKLIKQGAAELGIDQLVDVVSSDTFYWVRRQFTPTAEHPWLVFCSPPYDLYLEQTDNLLELIEKIAEQAPTGSIIVVESDERFDQSQLPWAADWICRSYSPAEVAIWRKLDDHQE